VSFTTINSVATRMRVIQEPSSRLVFTFCPRFSPFPLYIMSQHCEGTALSSNFLDVQGFSHKKTRDFETFHAANPVRDALVLYTTLHSRMLSGFTMLLGLNPGHA
jgi:hypothetical protein